MRSLLRSLAPRVWTSRLARRSFAVAILGLALIAATAPSAFAQTYSCANDVNGVNDEPGQKDLTKLCVSPGSGATSLFVKWQWDETGSSGNNTLDGCSLYDTDGDGLANLAACVSTLGEPAALGAVTLYTCNNTSPDRCSGAAVVTTGSTACTVNAATDPFPGGDSAPNDAGTSCSIVLADFGTGATSAKLLDVCSYPSAQPNSDPSDCVFRGSDIVSCSSDAQCPADSNPCVRRRELQHQRRRGRVRSHGCHKRHHLRWRTDRHVRRAKYVQRDPGRTVRRRLRAERDRVPRLAGHLRRRGDVLGDQ
jgi:hypothetical protein